MCLACNMKVKAVHDGAPSFYAIPCGTCKECNEVYQKSWSFRLRFELQALELRHWQCGFCTLTYSDASLPHYPVSVFKDIHDFKEVMCFSRDDCEKFIRNLRSWLWREYRLSGQDACRYMLCSEYGSNTKRSHYHLLIACPPQVDMGLLFAKIHQLWELNGHVFPRYFNGGVDSHGYRHKPFVVASCAAAAKYTAKYTTKDMYYNEHLESLGLSRDKFNTDLRLYRRCAQFHLQSRSLGRSMLDNLSDAEKLNVLKNGYQFIGDDKLYTIPIYIRNKMVFDNRYIYEYETPKMGQDGSDDVMFFREKRLCRREANVFFLEHWKEIFDLKVKKYSEFFRKMGDYVECRARGLDDETARQNSELIDRLLERYECSYDKFAECYLACYGLPDSKRLDCAFSLQWLGHYIDLPLYEFDDDFWGFDKSLDFCRAVSFCAGALFRNWYKVRSAYTDADRLNDRIRDYFASLE